MQDASPVLSNTLDKRGNYGSPVLIDPTSGGPSCYRIFAFRALTEWGRSGPARHGIGTIKALTLVGPLRIQSEWSVPPSRNDRQVTRVPWIVESSAWRPTVLMARGLWNNALLSLSLLATSPSTGLVWERKRTPLLYVCRVDPTTFEDLQGCAKWRPWVDREPPSPTCSSTKMAHQLLGTVPDARVRRDCRSPPLRFQDGRGELHDGADLNVGLCPKPKGST